MATGGCFCERVRVQYDGQPIVSALCHCLDCRKLTGTLYTYNLLVKSADFKITCGSPKEIAKTSDSGHLYKNYFCPDCGTPLYGMKIKSDGAPDDVTVIRAGILDDVEMLEQLKPQVELYSDKRIKWIGPTEGADQIIGMLHQK